MWTNRICRNPVLQRMFMRLGRAEKAGSGVNKIVSGWRHLGWPTPTVTEETCPDYVVLTMPVWIIRRKIPHKKDEKIWQILICCKEPRSTSGILEHLGLSKNLIITYLNPMVAKDVVTMTKPGTPTIRR